MTDRSPFESSLPEAQRAAAGLPVDVGAEASERASANGAGAASGAARISHAIAPCGVEQQVIAALEDGFVRFLVEAEPGIELQRMLLSFPPALLGPSSQLAWLRAHARCTAWWAAQEAHALVAFAGPRPRLQTFDVRGERVTLEDVAREEVAIVSRWTSNFAQTRIDEARLLVGALQQTRRALETGEISSAHVRVIAESAAKLTLTTPPDSERFIAACELLERRVLPVAARQGLSRTRTAANRAVTEIDPDGRMERRTAAYRGRGVWLRDDCDGVSTIIGRLASEHAHAAMAAIDALALADDFGDATLGSGERRSLAMLHLVLHGASATNADSTATPPGSGAGDAADASRALDSTRPLLPPIRAHVDVIVDLPTLLGLQDNDGEIVGGGSISAESMRDLVLADTTSTMRRLVTDPTTGHLLDIGRRRYVIPTALREFIEIRDQRCRFPGCNARATKAEVDHALPWDEGGTSDRSNLGALCKRHHQVKTHGGWAITASADSGACDWKSPSGSKYVHGAVALAAPGSYASAESSVPLPHRDVGETRHLIDDDT